MSLDWLRQQEPFPLVPAKAGTQSRSSLDSRLRGNERGAESRLSKTHLALVCQFDVQPSPRLIVDQAPAMSRADRVGCQQHVAGAQDKRLAIARGEFKRPGQRNDVLITWRDMPIE